MKIGFLDSGMGGLSVLHQAFSALPNEQFLFYADRDHVPYGEKTTEEVVQYVTEAVEFMVSQGVKAIVIACNTATSAAIRILRSKYDFPIVGMEPAVKKAVDLYGDKRVLATATPITVHGEKMRCLIERVDKEHLVDLVALPKLVHFAEAEQFDTEEVREYLAEELKDFDLNAYGSLVLGCTHFNYFKESFRSILPEQVRFVDGNEGTLNYLISELRAHDLLEDQKQSVEYYYSGRKVEDPEELEKIGRFHEQLERMLRL